MYTVGQNFVCQTILFLSLSFVIANTKNITRNNKLQNSEQKIQSNSNVLFKLLELHQRCKMRFSYPTYVLSFSYPMRTKEIIVLSCQHNLAGTQQINFIEVFRQSLSFLQS